MHQELYAVHCMVPCVVRPGLCEKALAAFLIVTVVQVQGCMRKPWQST